MVIQVGIVLTKELFTSAEICAYIQQRPSSHKGAPPRTMRLLLPLDISKSLMDYTLNSFADFATAPHMQKSTLVLAC